MYCRFPVIAEANRIMRVAVLHNHPIHYKHLLFTALASLGVEVDVIFTARSSNLRTTSLQPAGERYRSHFLSDGSFESLPQTATALRAVCAVEQCHPDVVIIGGYSYLAAWSTLAWAKLRNKPVALWFQSNLADQPQSTAKNIVKRIFVSACDAGHVYGQSSRAYLEYLGMNSASIMVKRATVDSGLFMSRRSPLHSDFRRFVYVGRFSPEKNLPRLLEAFRVVRNQNKAELMLIGYGPDEPLLRQKTQDLDLGESVVFTGPKTQDEVSQALAESDCLVLPSLSEPWGLVVNEALCTGIPVIVSDRCGCAPDLVSESTGWMFEAEDTGQLAEALGLVCRLPLGRLQEMGQAAVELAVEYSPDACARRIVGSLVELLAKRGSANKLLNQRVIR
jgi:glycosyltransferase involved in cell wall biosynthesis